MNLGGSSSSSTPVDMTPTAFKNLQEPFASVIANLLGFQQPTQGTGTGGRSRTTGATGTTRDAGFDQSLVVKPGDNMRGVNPVQGAFVRGNPGQMNTGIYQRLSDGRLRELSKLEVENTPRIQASGPDTSAGGGNSTYYFPWELGSGAGNFDGTGGGQGAWVPTGDASDPLRGIPTFDGALVAEMTDAERAALVQIEQLAQSGNEEALAALRAINPNAVMDVVRGFSQYGTEPIADFMSQFQSGYQMSPDNVNPFLDATIASAQRPTLQALEETLTRTLPGRFTQAGQFIQPQGSSAFDRAAAIASRGAADAMSDIATGLSFNTYESEANRQFQAMQEEFARRFTGQEAQKDRLTGAAQSDADRQLGIGKALADITQQEFDNAIKNLQAQALPRLIEEYGIERGIQQFNNRLNTLMVLLQTAAGVTSPVIANESESSSFQFGIG